MEIETPRLRLRPWRLEDKPALLRHADNPKVSRNLFNMFRSPYTEADADAWIQSCLALEGPCAKFAIEIGEITLLAWPDTIEGTHSAIILKAHLLDDLLADRKSTAVRCCRW